jgi:hypothetical protein
VLVSAAPSYLEGKVSLGKEDAGIGAIYETGIYPSSTDRNLTRTITFVDSQEAV